MAHEVHEIGGVFPVMDRERGVEANFKRILPQKPRADRMKGAGPGEGICHHTGLWTKHLCGNALDATLHLGGSAAREGQEHHATRIGARHDEMRHAMRERGGFTRASARDDQQWRNLFEITASVFDCAALVRIESGEVCRAQTFVRTSRRMCCFRPPKPCFPAAYRCCSDSSHCSAKHEPQRQSSGRRPRHSPTAGRPPG